MRQFIPQREIARSSDHPWLTPECRHAVRQKAAAAGAETSARRLSTAATHSSLPSLPMSLAPARSCAPCAGAPSSGGDCR
eukprot:409979-Alexandrium_andersonii.AAC.1